MQLQHLSLFSYTLSCCFCCHFNQSICLSRWELLYIMRCQHGEKITKFCITEHCHHKEAAGCDYCIKKYHFHLTNTTLLAENELEAIVKTLTSSSEAKFKSRALQDLASDYLRQVRQAMSNWFDTAQSLISERLTHPLLRKQGLLGTYQRIRNRDYRKLNAKQLKAINDFAKGTQPQLFKRQQIQTYFAEVEWTAAIVDAAQNFAKELTKLPPLKDTQLISPIAKSSKLNETFESILRQKDRYQSQERQPQKQRQFLKPQSAKLQEVMKSSSLMKNRMTRQLSSKQKSSTPNKEILNEILVRKTTINDNLARIGSTIPVALVEPKVQVQEKFGNQTKDQRAKRLRRRRSSIDQGINDLKFGQQDRQKQVKQLQLKKKQILETVFSSHSKQTEKQTKSQPEQKQNITETNTVHSEASNQAKLTVEPVTSKERERSAQKKETNPSAPIYDNRSQFSPNKDSQQNIFQTLFPKMGVNVAELINSIIPAPPIAKLRNENEVFTNKVVKIPIADKQHIDQIQSPIFKNKRKMDRQHNTGTGFGISLNPVQAKQEDLPLPVVKEQMKEQTQKLIPNSVKPASKPLPEQQVIVLQSNQTNSLCLFSEAVKSSTEKAIQLLKAALKFSPQNLSAAEYLSYLYLQSGMAKQCLEVCQSILLKIEDKAEQFEVTLHLHNNRAAALNMLGRYSQSIVVLQKCLKFRRKHYFYKNLADAYFSLGIPEKAAMNYEKAIRLDPGYDEAFYNLAVTQFIQEEYTSAKLNIDLALKIDSVNQSYRELQREIAKRVENIMK